MMENGAESTGYPLVLQQAEVNSIQSNKPANTSQSAERKLFILVLVPKLLVTVQVLEGCGIGILSEETRKFMQVGLDAENMTIDLMRHGVTAGEVAEKVHSYITKKGYGDTILYGPAIVAGKWNVNIRLLNLVRGFVLEKGMVFMVDIFLAKQDMGFRWEDRIIITDGEAEELSNYKRKINVL